MKSINVQTRIDPADLASLDKAMLEKGFDCRGRYSALVHFCLRSVKASLQANGQWPELNPEQISAWLKHRGFGIAQAQAQSENDYVYALNIVTHEFESDPCAMPSLASLVESLGPGILTKLMAFQASPEYRSMNESEQAEATMQWLNRQKESV